MFVTPTWESNVSADKTCKELFKKKYSVKAIKSKKKVKSQKDKLNNECRREGKSKISSATKTRNPLKYTKKSDKAQRKEVTKTKYASKNRELKESKTTNLMVENGKDKKRRKSKNKNKQKVKSNNNQLLETHDNVQEEKQNRKRKFESNKLTQSPSTKEKKQKLDRTVSNLQQNNVVKCDKKLKRNKMNLSLRERMMEKLKAARFRYINEQIYTNSGNEIKKYFENDVDAFKAYHAGYRQQVQRWNINPVDIIIKSIKKMPKHLEIADFGCGDAKLSKSVEQKVHSFDVIAVDETVKACDMAHVPLNNHSVDIVVFCLSLMGTNLQDYLLEANRVLKIGGVLKIAEVESRFDTVDTFIKGVEHYGFTKVWKDLSHKLFYFIDFRKEKDVSRNKKLPTISLNPCLYKKR